MEEEQNLEDEKKACSGLKEQLISCLRNSECMQKDGHTLKECMQTTIPGVGEECRQIQYSFFECRRSMNDVPNKDLTCALDSEEGKDIETIDYKKSYLSRLF